MFTFTLTVPQWRQKKLVVVADNGERNLRQKGNLFFTVDLYILLDFSFAFAMGMYQFFKEKRQSFINLSVTNGK